MVKELELEEILQTKNITKRVCVSAVEEFLYKPIAVLDHGFIRVVDYMGDDSSIIQAARVSYGRGTKKSLQDKGLINYLMRHRHTTPFEMCDIKFHVKLPIFVARQWIRHRTASVNEYSARYSILANEFYLPQKVNLAPQSKINKQWRDWLKGSNPHLSVTFDSSCAIENQDAILLTPLHPLLKQGARAFEPEKKITTAIEVWTDDIPEGLYPFALYRWQLFGIRNDLLMYPVCELEQLREKLPEFLEHGRTLNIAGRGFPSKEVFEKLDAKHYQLWRKKQQEHRDQSTRTVEFKKESLTTSYEAQLTVLNEQLVQANNEKIKRMRQSQLDSAKAEYATHMANLEAAINQVDITAMVVAWGVVQVNAESHEGV